MKTLNETDFQMLLNSIKNNIVFVEPDELGNFDITERNIEGYVNNDLSLDYSFNYSGTMKTEEETNSVSITNESKVVFDAVIFVIDTEYKAEELLSSNQYIRLIKKIQQSI